MRLRHGVALASVVGTLLLTAHASAWQEEHLAGDEAHVRVDAHGAASFEHVLKWRVVHGPLKSIELVGVDRGADLDPTASVRTEDGRELQASVVRGDDAIVRVTLESPQGLGRGVVTFDVRWQIDLFATHAIVPDGSSWRLSWSLPVAVNGFDLPRIILDVPAAPEPPRSLGADLSAPEQGSGETDTLRREGDRDILEIVRPYAAHGESVIGAVRLDPRALPELAPPGLPPANAVSATAMEPTRWPWLTALVALGLAWGLCVNRSSALGLVPLPVGLRAALAGLALTLGAVLQNIGELVGGGVLVAACVLLSALRSPPRSGPVARGPGRWFPLRSEDAFVAKPWWRDLPWRAVLCVAILSGAGWGAARVSPEGPWLVVLDCAPLVALWATGRRSQSGSVDLTAAGKRLRPSFSKLKASKGLRVVAWGRIGLDGAIDELRIRVMPLPAVPGVVGIEMGDAWTHTPFGWAPSPEVMVRFLDGSAAAAKIGQAMPGLAPISGRRAQERVLRLTPSRPTYSACRDLVGRAAEILTDRRAGSNAARHTGAERRMRFPASAPSDEPREWGPSIADAAC
jgi:hypothetical protein